jgi:hypothetical protein
MDGHRELGVGLSSHRPHLSLAATADWASQPCALAQRGARVLLATRDEAKAEQAAANLRADGLDVQGVQLDVTSHASIAAAVERVRQSQDRLDVLINNVGVLPEATDSSEHDFVNLKVFKQTFTTNLMAEGISVPRRDHHTRSAGMHVVPAAPNAALCCAVDGCEGRGRLDETHDLKPFLGDRLVGQHTDAAILLIVRVDRRPSRDDRVTSRPSIGPNELHGRRRRAPSPARGRILGQVAQVLDGRLATGRADAADRDRPAAMRHREGVVGLGESVRDGGLDDLVAGSGSTASLDYIDHEDSAGTVVRAHLEHAQGAERVEGVADIGDPKPGQDAAQCGLDPVLG